MSDEDDPRVSKCKSMNGGSYINEVSGIFSLSNHLPNPIVIRFSKLYTILAERNLRNTLGRPEVGILYSRITWSV